jgi:hypothetical protein
VDQEEVPPVEFVTQAKETELLFDVCDRDIEMPMDAEVWKVIEALFAA